MLNPRTPPQVPVPRSAPCARRCQKIAGQYSFSAVSGRVPRPDHDASARVSARARPTRPVGRRPGDPALRGQHPVKFPLSRRHLALLALVPALALALTGCGGGDGDGDGGRPCRSPPPPRRSPSCRRLRPPPRPVAAPVPGPAPRRRRSPRPPATRARPRPSSSTTASAGRAPLAHSRADPAADAGGDQEGAGGPADVRADDVQPALRARELTRPGRRRRTFPLAAAAGTRSWALLAWLAADDPVRESPRPPARGRRRSKSSPEPLRPTDRTEQATSGKRGPGPPPKVQTPRGEALRRR